MVTRDVSTPRWLGFTLVMLAIAACLWGVLTAISRPVVLYDEDASGNQICTQVETDNGVTSCESYTADELSTFEWQPALSMPK